MMDEAQLISEVKAAGERFLRLEEMAKEQGLEVRIVKKYRGLLQRGEAPGPDEIQVLKQVG